MIWNSHVSIFRSFSFLIPAWWTQTWSTLRCRNCFLSSFLQSRRSRTPGGPGWMDVYCRSLWMAVKMMEAQIFCYKSRGGGGDAITSRRSCRIYSNTPELITSLLVCVSDRGHQGSWDWPGSDSIVMSKKECWLKDMNETSNSKGLQPFKDQRFPDIKLTISVSFWTW